MCCASHETSVSQRLASVKGTVCYMQNGRFCDSAVRSGFLETLSFREALDESLGTVRADVVTAVRLDALCAQ